MRKLAPLMILLCGRLPLGLGRRLGRALGKLMWWSNSRAAQVTVKNLAVAYPELSDAERHLLAKRSIQQTAITAFEAAQVWIKPHRWLEQQITGVHNQSLVEQAVAAGRGVLFIGPHLGNWEVTSPWICARWGMTAMYAPSKNPELDRLILNSREKAGSTLVPANLKGVMALIKALKKGQVVGILPDQVPEESGGLYAPFFKRPALTMTLIHKLIAKTGCSAIMVCAKRTEGGFDMVFAAPDEKIYSDDEHESVSALNRSIETMVNKIPDQYQWEYKRYRKAPEGVDKLY